MQRRNSTKSRGLGRRKSVSSVKSVQLQHISPERAERDAQAAATQAFTKAKERAATDAVVWPPPRHGVRPDLGRYHSTPERGGSTASREQSVRFVKPKHEQRNQNTPTGLFGNRWTEDDLEPHPPGETSAASMGFAPKGMAGDYISALITGDEYYTPKDDVASIPSSYRRLRKSRSMFTSSETTDASKRSRSAGRPSATLQQLPKSNEYYSTPPPEENIPPGLKAPKSLSFLKPRRDQVSTHIGNKENMPLSTRRPVLVASQSSVFFQPSSAYSEKAFKKTLRDATSGTAGAGANISKDRNLRNKARKVSQNFKHKLKSLFSLVRGETEDAAFPPQHIVAQRNHGTETKHPEDEMEADAFTYDQSEDAALSRVTSGIPSLHAIPSEQRLRSRQGSVESLPSVRKVSDDRSRVTSWTNSDTNTTNTLNSYPGDWERPRLSVINENGMHKSSMMTSHPTKCRPWTSRSDIAAELPYPKPIEAAATTDSQKIYSALAKRLTETQSFAQGLDQRRLRSVEDLSTEGTIPVKSFSTEGHGGGESTPATIRHVVSPCDSESVATRTASGLTIVLEPQYDTTGRTSWTNEDGVRVRADTGMLRAQRDENTDHMNMLPVRSRTSPAFGEISQPAHTLSNRSSAFFGSPTCHLFRTQSPYRRILQESMKATADIKSPKSPEFNPWMRSLNSLPIRCPSACEPEVDKKMAYAESIYSSTTAESNNSSCNTLSLVDKFPRPPSNHGDAKVFIDPPSYRLAIPSRPTHRVASSTSSVEWKTWLSAKVSRLEQTALDKGVNGSTPLHPVDVYGHFRESTQIGDEEDVTTPTETTEPETRNGGLGSIKNSAMKTNTIFNEPSGGENQAPEPASSATRGTLRSAPSTTNLVSVRDRPKTPLEHSRRGILISTRRKSLAHASPSVALRSQLPNGLTARFIKRELPPKSLATSSTQADICTAVDKQFGPVGGSPDAKHRPTMAGAENIKPNAVTKEDYCSSRRPSTCSIKSLEPQALAAKESRS